MSLEHLLFSLNAHMQNCADNDSNAPEIDHQLNLVWKIVKGKVLCSLDNQDTYNNASFMQAGNLKIDNTNCPFRYIHKRYLKTTNIII